MFHDFSAQLVEKTNLAGQVWKFRFKIDGEPLVFTAGQYVLLCVQDKVRQYSISSSSLQGETLDLIVEYFPGGLASEYLKILQNGDIAKFKGPAGVFTLRNTPLNKLFLATGTGIAPEKSMIETYLTIGGAARLYLFFGLKTRGDVYLAEEFQSLANRHKNFSYTYCLSREKSLEGLEGEGFMQGHVQDAVNNFMQYGNPADFEYYVCGNKDVVEVLKTYASSIGGLPEKIFFEKFTV